MGTLGWLEEPAIMLCARVWMDWILGCKVGGLGDARIGLVDGTTGGIELECNKPCISARAASYPCPPHIGGAEQGEATYMIVIAPHIA